MTQNFPQDQLIDSWFSVNWSKVNWYTEKSNFDFLVKIKCQRSQFIKTCQNMKLINQEIKKSRFHFEKLKCYNRNFSKCLKLHVFHNFKPIFHHDTRGFRRNFQQEICRSHVNLQLSCWKFIFNHLASWWKIGLKLWKNMKLKHLEKFLS